MAGQASIDRDRTEEIDMRKSVVKIFVLLFVLASLAAGADSLADLKARAEAAKPEDQPPLFVEVAERQLKNADELYVAGKVDEALESVKDVVAYAGKAHDSALKTGKKVKDTEIALRKMAARLRDIKRTLNFDDQAPVQAAADQVDNLRSDLLNKMFAKHK